MVALSARVMLAVTVNATGESTSVSSSTLTELFWIVTSKGTSLMSTPGKAAVSASVSIAEVLRL